MHYVGADLHKESTWFYVMDETGKKLSSTSIPNSNDLLKEYLEQIPRPFTVAVEATFNWYFFVDLAEQYAEQVFLANSYETKAFAKRHKKTDKIDARLIADLLRKGFLPTVTIPGKEVRMIKEALRYRMNMARDRSRLISRLKCLLSKLGLNASGDFTTYKQLHQVDMNPVPPIYKEVIAGYVARIEVFHREIYEYDKYLNDIVSKDEDMVNLMSVPGIGHFGAALIKTEIIDVNRFSSFSRLCAYAGLAPRTHQSADKTIHGHLMSNRRKLLQWILIECSYHFVEELDYKKKKFEEISRRKSPNTARVTLARDLLKVIYHLLKEKRPFSNTRVRYPVNQGWLLRSTVSEVPAFGGQLP